MVKCAYYAAVMTCVRGVTFKTKIYVLKKTLRLHVLLLGTDLVLSSAAIQFVSSINMSRVRMFFEYFDTADSPSNSATIGPFIMG